jgi:myo-inositol 2-dehydrogenase/D-chiro-inositol 1-dehydrogenase
VEVFGERGMLRAANLRETWVESWNDRHTAAQDVLLPFFMERYGAAYVAELDAFIAAVEGGGPMSPALPMALRRFFWRRPQRAA